MKSLDERIRKKKTDEINLRMSTLDALNNFNG